ncbi:mimecan-like [Leptonychotes weddellii]|uniref:Mimecan-like n=1 Tax=Leptonychotes weddellii TaxID=9713 RepID=A0A7F8QFT3_LEPWE|nr:mimecan-like [Leptonychotes weddellii]XP_030879094.1 mimecan-like [Leptonychotes weddellii]
MKTLPSILLLLLFVPLIMPAAPTQQDPRKPYDYGTDNFEETLFSQDLEDKYLDGKNIKEKETMIIPEEGSLQLQKDERVTPPPLKKENDDGLGIR